ncbi:hypothetical protein IAR50_003870 [Cryptococcus sp. DSM 104548]
MKATGWQVDANDKAAFDQVTERTHAVLSRKSEKAVQNISAESLLDNRSHRYDESTFNETKIGDQEDHPRYKLKVASQKFVLDDGRKKLTGLPVYYVKIEREIDDEKARRLSVAPLLSG